MKAAVIGANHRPGSANLKATLVKITVVNKNPKGFNRRENTNMAKETKTRPLQRLGHSMALLSPRRSDLTRRISDRTPSKMASMSGKKPGPSLFIFPKGNWLAFTPTKIEIVRKRIALIRSRSPIGIFP